ncbi:hypothetical protein QN277_014351 [Acacia crassicarpa]|uniref:Lysine-specific demethylase JMJ25 n=1 Tax=Acacia crassicarpa TaxID=499986 RepID=A0AAE1M4E0_9FABA|nr:hypothetical protein QN277_014351 [Acacia crassicarpa]
MVEEEGVLPDHLRCSRTDGRQWRCRRRVMDNLKLCEIHYLQGRHRQYKEKVPESLKLQRKRKNGSNDSKNDAFVLDNVEIRALNIGKKANLIKKRPKFWDSSEAVDAHPVKKKALKQGGMQLELIRIVLKREIEKRKKKQRKNKKEEEEEEGGGELIHYSEGERELTRELPNGVMAISSASTPQDYNNVSSYCDVKVGIDHKAITPRYFRSKNVEKLPAGKLQVLPLGQNLKKFRRKKCHWCQKSDSWNLIKCSSCQKEFFCMDCIKERYFETQNEVKMTCPVCRGTCSCKDCLASQCKESESKEYLASKGRVDRILCFHYMICMLLPLLKQISEDNNIELAKSKSKEKRTSDILIKEVEFRCNEQNCWIPIKLKDGIASENHLLDVISNGNSTATSSPDCTICNGSGNLSCPPPELGGYGDCLLDLRCVFPISLIREMETKAEEISCCFDFPESLDKSSSCSLCLSSDNKIGRYKQWQEAALREDSNDNCLFYPTVLDISRDNFEHFQKHWRKGHPVVVRDVLQSKSNYSWDPLVMFCSYLEQSITRYQNDKDLLETCLDWCEVEINFKHYFSGSLRCQPQKNTWHEMLKLKGWLSSQLFKEQFPTHFAQVIAALPLQEYMNPMSGILNLAANLPQGSAKHDIGPFVYMSYGCADEQVDSVTKLCYDSYDVVNIMAHSTDVPLSSEQLTKIRKLLKKHQNLCQTESPRIITEKIMGDSLKENSLLHAEDKEQNGVQSMVREEMNFFRRVDRTTYISTEAGKEARTAQDTPLSTFGNPRYSSDSSNNDRTRSLADHSGAQWDVFRRQDVPKLIEYLKRHCIEFADTQNYQKKMIHPILDQIFFLDNTHKMRLKEEFEIEPWTFEQHVGEAVIIPAGCPYQIKNPKCCVHVILEFVSPENVTESIELIDEVHLPPEGHIAKVDKLEMKKMALYSMRTAIKEIGDLTYKK